MADGCSNMVMSNETGEKSACGKMLFRGKLCESCFFDVLSRLNHEYQNHRNNMISTVDKIKNLFENDDDGNTN